MKLLELIVIGYLVLGLTSFSAWSVYLYANTDCPVTADRTTKVIWNFGRLLPWAAISVLAAGLFGLAAHTTWNLIIRG